MSHDQSEFCKTCKKTFASWELYLLHKLQDDLHICCIVCGRDFKTTEGRDRHHVQDHAAKQDLSCAGCGMKFSTVGGYISHVEQHQCQVIHKSEFDKLRTAKEIWHKVNALKKDMANEVPTFKTQTQSQGFQENDVSEHRASTQNSSVPPRRKYELVTAPAAAPAFPSNFDVDDGGPLNFQDPPVKDPSWETWGDEDDAKLKDFPILSIQNVAPVMAASRVISNVNMHGTEPASEMVQPSASPKASPGHSSVKQNIGSLSPDTDISVTIKQPLELLKMMAQDPSNSAGFDNRHPNHPDFSAAKYWNNFTKKYRCPFIGCRKLQNTSNGLIQHLLSPAHMDERLRCPACLRQFNSATSLVQHAESQALTCNIRDSNEYRQALDQITGGLVGTAGRHEDKTVKYAGGDLETLMRGKGVREANQAYWEQKAADQEKEAAEMAANVKW